MTSAQGTSTGDGVGSDRNVEETEVICKELLRQGWKAAGAAALSLWELKSRAGAEWRTSVTTASTRGSSHGGLCPLLCSYPVPPWGLTKSVSFLVIPPQSQTTLGVLPHKQRLPSLLCDVLSSLCCYRWWWTPTWGKHSFLVPPSSLSLSRAVH